MTTPDGDKRGLDHCEHQLERRDDQRWVCTKCGRVIVAGRRE